MRVLVIPDIHLKTWIFDRAEKILKDGKADRAVCLMDIPDDWNMEFQIEQYIETVYSNCYTQTKVSDKVFRPCWKVL